MRYILVSILFFNLSLFAQTKSSLQNMSIVTKKARFYHLVVPVVHKVYKELQTQYVETLKDINSSKNSDKIKKLKKEYGVATDKELLVALKPHPQSIALAQAAMESAWATSKFFIRANNIFGIWSTNKNEPRVAANQKRDGNKTIWLKKFHTLEDSVRFYYKTIAKHRAYKEFRKVRYSTNDVMKMIKKLDKYSETGRGYTKKLGGLIRYNKLTKYDK